MSKNVKLKRGFDINIVGKPEGRITEVAQPETFAIKPTDFYHISGPKLLVKEGDNVKVGTPLFYEKSMGKVMFCAPVSGEIVEIKRGAKRKLLEVKILADKELEVETFKSYSTSEVLELSRDLIIDNMCEHGVWSQLVQRPFGVSADPADTPKAIFISGFDTNPNAPDTEFILQGKEEHFKAGIEVLKKLTSGTVHIGLNGSGGESAFGNIEGVQTNNISGAHPAGNVGVHIHHIDPVNKGELIWTATPYGVAQIGQLFSEGVFDASKVVAVTGSEVDGPSYVKTYSGACLNKIVDKMVKAGNNRVISGNVLTGENVGKDGYLGYFSNQISVIPEGDYEELLGWILPSTKKLSFHKTFGLLSFLSPGKERVVDTNLHGEPRNFVMTGALEKVLPMDILPMYLFKAIMTEDYENMEALGIYELIEEDVALCEFIDVSKHSLQEILREGIEMVRTS